MNSMKSLPLHPIFCSRELWMQPWVASAMQQPGHISTPAPGVKPEPAVGSSFAAQEFWGAWWEKSVSSVRAAWLGLAAGCGSHVSGQNATLCTRGGLPHVACLSPWKGQLLISSGFWFFKCFRWCLGVLQVSLEPFCLAEQCLVKYFDADSSGVAGLSPL